MAGKTGPITAQGKEVSKQNALKHGLYLHFADFFPCNLCRLRDSCKDFFPGSSCKVDQETFQAMLKEELNEMELFESLIKYNIVRLNRATEQLKKEPYHSELTRIASEIRQSLQSLYLMKHRRDYYGRKTGEM